jgi:NAD(P)-dependent dehydrogenase (short-subunit alcohol dehydrogenase family)
MSDALRLFGLRALVTDAGTGIGEAVARTFSQHGAQVLAVDSPASGIETHYRGVHGITPCALDMFRQGAADDLLGEVETQFGSLDIVVNNYDWQTGTPIGQQDETELEKLLHNIETQITAVGESVVPLLQRSPAGRIVNIGCMRSIFALDAEVAAERARKTLATVTGRLAAQTGNFGITVNYVQPGAIMTAASRRIFSANTDLRDYCISNSAAGRLGEPIDIAKVVLFLATDDAAFITGTGIAADGGLMPRG